MGRPLAVLTLIGCLGAAGIQCTPAAAAPQTYEYRVKHATYGDIGSYTNTIERTADGVHVQTVVRIAVKIFGATLYREDADRTELWKDGRLVFFHSVTSKNGKRLEVIGEARGDQFAVYGPDGATMAPANVQPPNPWSSDCLKSDTMISSVTGKLYPAVIHDDGDEMVTAAGQHKPAHRWEIDTDRPHTVWFDERGIPVMLQSIEDGEPVRLVLSRYPETVTLAAMPQEVR